MYPQGAGSKIILKISKMSLGTIACMNANSYKSVNWNLYIKNKDSTTGRAVINGAAAASSFLSSLVSDILGFRDPPFRELQIIVF